MHTKNKSTADGGLIIAARGFNLVEGVKALDGTSVRISARLSTSRYAGEIDHIAYIIEVYTGNPSTDHWVCIRQSDWGKYVTEQEILEVKTALWESIRPTIAEEPVDIPF